MATSPDLLEQSNQKHGRVTESEPWSAVCISFCESSAPNIVLAKAASKEPKTSAEDRKANNSPESHSEAASHATAD